MPRPAIEDLEVVPDAEAVVRRISLSHFDITAQVGERVQIANCASKDYTPTPTNYGPSIFVKSRCSIERILAANPKWAKHKISRFTVAEVKERLPTLRVAYSPDDCQHADLRDGHASLLGVDKNCRDALVRFFDEHIVES